MKPSIEDLIFKLEEKFGKLNSEAEHHAEDILEHYDAFIDSIIAKKIFFVIDPYTLAKSFHDYKYSIYQTFSFLSFLSVIIGVITSFFNWKYGIILFFLAFVLRKISSHLRLKNSQCFAKELYIKFLGNLDEGMFDVCQYYIAGMLQLVSNEGTACLPIIPSYSITGIKTFARRN